MKPLTICLLGATGSIGGSTLDVLRAYPEKFRLVSAAAGKNWRKMKKIAEEFQLRRVCLTDEVTAKELRQNSKIEVLTGMESLLDLVSDKEIQYVINGLVGSIGCAPTLRAIESGKKVGLANKETMVMAGEIINRALQNNPGSLLVPIDSEHSAIFQCLQGRPVDEIEKLILTASGGPFRTLDREQFKNITIESALKHPTWDMGPKITIDSATMMNKGLEVIEALFLFNCPLSSVDIVIHPDSIAHSFVQFRDGSLLSQLGSPDMKLPIQYALTYPERWPLSVDRLDLTQIHKLEFFPPDKKKFPCIELAYQAGKRGGTTPAILNAANEVAVDLFLRGTIPFQRIPEIIEEAMIRVPAVSQPKLEDVFEADRVTREVSGKNASGANRLA